VCEYLALLMSTAWHMLRLIHGDNSFITINISGHVPSDDEVSDDHSTYSPVCPPDLSSGGPAAET
jgi:hypothetical protein